jgi:hypothetical protein
MPIDLNPVVEMRHNFIGFLCHDKGVQVGRESLLVNKVPLILLTL